MTKRGTPPPKKKTLTKRRTLFFVDREVSDVRVVVGINPTAQQDMCASTVHFIYMFTITVSEQPNAQRPVAQVLSSPKSQTYIRLTYLICAPRVCILSKKSLIICRAYWTEEEEYSSSSCWSLSCDHGLRCSDELMWEQQQQQQQQQQHNSSSRYSCSSAENVASKMLCAQCHV